MSFKQNEAARWFAARRRGVMTLDERTAYDAWKKDRTNEAAFAELESVWRRLEIARAEFLPADAAPAHTYRPRRNVRFALLAATCLVSLGLGFLSHSGHSRFWTTLDWTNR